MISSNSTTSSSSTSTDWSMSTDIYDIVSDVDNLKKKYISDESETTLALGIFGFIGDTESKKIQTAVIGTGELGNEMFPQRAKLEKNVLTHAVYCGIQGINAVPAQLTINLAIKASDITVLSYQGVELKQLTVDSKASELSSLTSAEFPLKATYTFDHNCPINFDNYEFHLDYDIILTGVKRSATSNWVFKALYSMGDKDDGSANFLNNTLSSITNEYLKQPIISSFNNYTWIFMQTTVHQYSIETTKDVMITSSVIDNKSFTFTFDNQLAAFEVYVTENGKTTRITPYFYGSSIDQGTVNYCWYLYMNDSTIRIGFDHNSYIPGLSAEVKVIAYTTLGSSGNFNYKNNLTDSGAYAEFTDSYNNKITCYANCMSNSTLGTDRKSITELKKLIPKMALSRGYITTETDLNGYFNLISTDSNRLKLQKKVDNQLERIWFCYMLSKDTNGNIIPSNSLSIKVNLNDSYVVKDLDEAGNIARYVIPAGTNFMYDPSTGYSYVGGEISSKVPGYCVQIDAANIPSIYSDNYFGNKFYYKTIHNIVINTNPLYCAYYNTLVNYDDYFSFHYANDSADVGFIANTNHFERKLLTEQDSYIFTFNLELSNQDDASDYDFIVKDANGAITQNKLKVYLVLNKNDSPYRYVEASLVNYDGKYTSSWKIVLNTDNKYDTSGNIKLLNLSEIGKITSNTYGYFPDKCTATLHILANLGTENYGRGDKDYLDSQIPGLEAYTLMDSYDVANGLRLFTDYTQVMDTHIRQNSSADEKVLYYDISGIPMIGYHYFTSEDKVTSLMNNLMSEREYINNCLRVLENSMNIDFKFFNTYGSSYTYTIGDKENTLLDHVDTSWHFRMSLINANDSSTKETVITYIKEYIEDLDSTESFHMSNLLHDIKEKYSDRIEFIEYMYFNNYNTKLANHIVLLDDIDPHTVPEFINVRNHLSTDGKTLIPDIEIEIITAY